jgi:hypothetical protein
MFDSCSPLLNYISELVHFTQAEAHVVKYGLERLDETNVMKQFLKTLFGRGFNLS